MSIDVTGVTKRFGDFVAIDDVTVSLPTGQLTALLGPSGGGKSTLLRIIAGLDKADTGTVSIEGTDAMVPVLDEIIADAAENGADDVIIGMAHRGRLNVLTHVLGKPAEMMLAGFKAAQDSGADAAAQSAAPSAADARKTVRMVRTATPPVIDGKLDEAVWQTADVITDFQLHNGGSNGDLLQFKGFGAGATLTSNGNLFTVHAADGTVENVTLLGVTSLASSDYVFA